MLLWKILLESAVLKRRQRTRLVTTMIMFLLYAGILFTIALSLPHRALGNTILQDCKPDLREVINQLVQQELPHQSFSFEVKAYNDVRCDVPEDMANVAVILTRQNGASMYGIFHIHVQHYTNHLVGAVSFKDEMFISVINGSNWKEPWCNLMKYVYQDELEAQGCISPLPVRLDGADHRSNEDTPRQLSVSKLLK